MNALEWLGIGAATAGIVALATRGQGASAPAPAAGGTNGAPAPVPAPPPPADPNPPGTQARPFAPGWFATGQAAVWTIIRQQLPVVGYPCTDASSCSSAAQSFAQADGLPDPMYHNDEASLQAFAYALDDKYRRVRSLPAAPGAASGSLSLRRHRRAA